MLIRMASSEATAKTHIVCDVMWVMGFSRSSSVSQTTMLGICSGAGLGEDFVLSADTKGIGKTASRLLASRFAHM